MQKTAKRPVQDPISELRYISERKSFVWKEMNKLGRAICMMKNEYRRLEDREQLAAEMVEASSEQLTPSPPLLSPPPWRFFFFFRGGYLLRLVQGTFASSRKLLADPQGSSASRSSHPAEVYDEAEDEEAPQEELEEEAKEEENGRSPCRPAILRRSQRRKRSSQILT